VHTEPAARAIVETVFAAVVVFEIVGPILLRRCLLAAGEVKIASLVGQGVSGIKQSFDELVAQCAHNLGLKKPFRKRAHPQSLKPFIRHKVLALDADAPLDEVIKFISDHQFPIYPVVNKQNRFEGVIGLNEVKNVMFDPFFARLVLASELVESRERLELSDSPGKALETLAQSGRDYLPVVHPETGQYLGIVSHKDLLLAQQK
jgi:CBS domain-containing protein